MNEINIKKIIERKYVLIGGFQYDIEIKKEEVILTPVGDGDMISSFREPSEYAYSHGGKIYCAAQDFAWKVESHLKRERTEKSDVEVR